MTKPRLTSIGRRTGKSDTRKDILAAAQELFAEVGYSNATIQKIATRVNVDPSLVMYFFKNKQALFVEAVTPVYDPLAALTTLVGSDFSEQGERLASFFIDLLEDPQQGQIAQGLLRAAMTEPDVKDMLEVLFKDKMAHVIETIAPGKDVHMKANLVCAVYVGILTLRYIAKLQPLASLPKDAAVRYLAPLFQQCLLGIDE